MVHKAINHPIFWWKKPSMYGKCGDGGAETLHKYPSMKHSGKPHEINIVIIIH
jgi:hypothetical protein